MPPLIFTPLRIGNLELKNRIVMTPVVTHLDESRATDFYVARAAGGAGLVQLPPGIVDPSSDNGVARPLWDDQFLPALERLVDAIHSAGAKVSIQLFHAGRQFESVRSGTVAVAPSPIPWSRNAIVPRGLSVDDIRDLVNKFGEAARRARKAGVDFIEIHAAHGYLLSEFLSPSSNQRTDQYGGNLAGRVKFPVEVIRRIKETVGDFPVSCRINGADNISGGLLLDDAKTIAPILVNAGLDIISVSAGVFGSYPTIIPPYYAPRGCYVPFAEGVKSVVNVPVIVAGRINDATLAEEILRTGRADLVGMTRALIADPDLPRKIASGAFEDIRKCIACNVCIDVVDVEPIRCTVNPAAGREKELETGRATKRKRVMVIGGGPAGMEAARFAALRGHRVTLYEKEPHLGGQWRLAAAPPCKEELADFIRYESRQLDRLGVKVQPGKAVTVAQVREDKPDVVVVATGAVPAGLQNLKADEGRVVTAWDLLRGSRTVGSKVLVVGGGSVGLETAHLLAERGHNVTVIEMLERIGVDMGATLRWHLVKKLKERSVSILTGVKLRSADERGVVVSKSGSEEVWAGFDTIVLAVGSQSSNALATELKGVARELYVIGDALRPGKGSDAIRQGAEIGRGI